MKSIFWIVVLLVVVLGGYLVFFAGPDDGRNDGPTAGMVSFDGTVTAVDLDAIAFDGPALVTVNGGQGEARVIAVPSMGLPLCAALEHLTPVDRITIGDYVSVRGDVDATGRIVPCADADHYLAVTTTVRDLELGYQFSYPKGPVGYVQVSDEESADTTFISGTVLFDTREYQEFQASTDAREGPPAIHVRVYENPNKNSAAVWPIRKPRESNIELALAEPTEAVVGGANAVRYTVDGLYPTDTYIIANGQYIYVLMGAYLEEDSAIRRDFQSLVDSFTFIPTSKG